MISLVLLLYSHTLASERQLLSVNHVVLEHLIKSTYQNVDMLYFLFPNPGGGVTTICAGTGCTIFWGAFFVQKINFGVSFLVKSQVVIKFGVSFLKNYSLGY